MFPPGMRVWKQPTKNMRICEGPIYFNEKKIALKITWIKI